MFGKKQAKTERLDQLVEVLEQEPEISTAQLARRVDLSYQTVMRYLTSLEDHGILLQEHDGKLSLYKK